MAGAAESVPPWIAAQAATNDQNHDYGPEQAAFDGGLMDLFPANVGTAGTPPSPPPPIVSTTGLVMGYYDGNTVTGLWNYAQHFAMSDNSYDTTFGPSTPGALNLISAQTNGVTLDNNPGGATISDGNGGFSVIGDADPVGDACSTTTGETFQMGGKNIGDLLNAKGITWGFFEGGFNRSTVNPNKTTGCKRTTTSTITNVTKSGLYPASSAVSVLRTSTANPTHRPTIGAIGNATDAANHQYDSDDFYTALAANNLPSVVFLKAPGYQDGHAGYSDPLDEQTFIVDTINTIEQSKFWDSTAIVILYDDSDGWYDHQMSPILNHSATTRTICSTALATAATALMRCLAINQLTPSCPGSLRVRTAPAVAGDLAVREAQLRRSQHDQTQVFDPHLLSRTTGWPTRDWAAGSVRSHHQSARPSCSTSASAENVRSQPRSFR